MELLITVIVVLVVLGLLMWLVSKYLPINADLKMVINVLLIVVAAIYILSEAGIF